MTKEHLEKLFILINKIYKTKPKNLEIKHFFSIHSFNTMPSNLYNQKKRISFNRRSILILSILQP